jgi:hypothetical protein
MCLPYRTSEMRETEMKHTSGPWEVDKGEHKSKCHGHEIWTGGMLVAQVAGLAEFDAANAKLIAAAPTMLEALKSAERGAVRIVRLAEAYMEQGKQWSRIDANAIIAEMYASASYVDKVRAAIKQAEGE